MTTSTNTKTNTHFIIDFFNNTISGTKTSFNKAGKGISPYYQELTEKMNAHPDYELNIKELKKKSTKAKRTYEGLDFDFMEDYIRIQKNAEALMAEYKRVKTFAENSKMSIYPFTKKWFLGNFDADREGFDMATAKQEIVDWKMAQVILNAHDETKSVEKVPA